MYPEGIDSPEWALVEATRAAEKAPEPEVNIDAQVAARTDHEVALAEQAVDALQKPGRRRRRR
jgi:hypothetical protein